MHVYCAQHVFFYVAVNEHMTSEYPRSLGSSKGIG